MNSSLQKPSWLRAIKEAAIQQRIPIPPFKEAGMGSAFCRVTNGARFVSFKRRLVSASDAVKDGIEWTLWLEEDDKPNTVAAFREPLIPTPERVADILSILQGWLLDQWTVETAQQVAATHADSNVERIASPKNDRQEYWLSSNQHFGIVVENDLWAIYLRGQSLSVWRMKDNDNRGDRLSLESLDRLCLWLARHWLVIAYGKDVRPASLRERSVAASHAHDLAQFLPQEGKTEIDSWWNRHAIRAADSELPNVFLERQADEIVVSWDALPTPTRFYSIPNGEEVLSVRFAVPVLRQLVRDRLKVMHLKETERASLLTETSEDAVGAYSVLSQYKPFITKDWLTQHSFSDADARSFAIAGTSRHPVFGLLRTSQVSPMYKEDYEQILQLLRPSSSESYHKLREVAKGIVAPIDLREPWESGYRLASLVREKMKLSPFEPFDVETKARELGIQVHDVTLGDRMILGACIGAPDYAPLIALNQSCPDANGPSGRRITLAHELCHLLFDRSRMQSLARFEGAGADSDRLIEMRANAFAVELLVPRSTLIGDDGTILEEEELKKVSVDRQVSLTALSQHAANLRNRLAKQ